MSVKIETHKGFNIFFNPQNEKFFSQYQELVWSSPKLSTVRKAIDNYVENLKDTETAYYKHWLVTVSPLPHNQVLITFEGGKTKKVARYCEDLYKVTDSNTQATLQIKELLELRDKCTKELVELRTGLEPFGVRETEVENENDTK